jgi:hypothetical protein
MRAKEVHTYEHDLTGSSVPNTEADCAIFLAPLPEGWTGHLASASSCVRKTTGH